VNKYHVVELSQSCWCFT